MAIDNLISVTFSAEELQQLDEHLTALESLLAAKCISLTPEQRRDFGRIGNRSENWTRKVMDYIQNQPALVPAFLDVAETQRDFEARRAIQPRVARLEAISDMLGDTHLLLGTDLYQSSVAYYRNIKLLAGQNVNGAKAIYEDLSAQFPGRPTNTRKPQE